LRLDNLNLLEPQAAEEGEIDFPSDDAILARLLFLSCCATSERR
jgi:hypothetical protein